MVVGGEIYGSLAGQWMATELGPGAGEHIARGLDLAADAQAQESRGWNVARYP